MKAVVRERAGIYGLPMFEAGQTIEVRPFLDQDGHLTEYFLGPDGTVWPPHLLEIVEQEHATQAGPDESPVA